MDTLFFEAEHWRRCHRADQAHPTGAPHAGRSPAAVNNGSVAIRLI